MLLSTPPRAVTRPSLGPLRAVPYLPGLDGLRALAIAAVLVYHLETEWLRGGYLGVEVFFVVSGFLITALLLGEQRRDGGIDLLRFWRRRARRLLPALGVAVAGAWVLGAAFAPDGLVGFGREVLGAATYTTNWQLAASDASYFEHIGRPPLLQHLWSLAIEEQFYLVWPPLLLLASLLLGRRWLPLAVGGLAVWSALALAAGYDPAVDPSPLYYGTATRAGGILAGAALACAWRPWERLGALGNRLVTTPLGDVLGFAGLIVIGVQLVVLDGFTAPLYRGGLALTALATVAVVAAVAYPGSLLGVVLGAPPLRWLGTRSYSLYLWHWPVVVVLRPGVDTDLGEPWLTLLRLGATVLAAEASYRLVEVPVRERRFAAGLRQLYRASPDPRALVAGAGMGVAAAVVLLALSVVRLPADGGAVARAHSVPPAPITVADPAPAQPAPAPPPEYERVVVLGDSVVLGAGGALEASLPGVRVDGRIGRQWADAVDELPAFERQGTAVVVHLGHNAAVRPEDVEALLDELGGVERIVLLTVRVPKPWEGQVNRVLRQVAEVRPDVVVADWHAVADTVTELFDGDGVHLSPLGAARYAMTVEAALVQPSG